METNKDIETLEKRLKEEYPKFNRPKRKFWTDKEGNKLTFKEFTQRWKKGLEGITPLQQTRTQIFGIRIIIIGLLCGIVICIMGIKTLWWLFLILVGGLVNASVQYLGFWQKKKLLEQFEDLTKPQEVKMEQEEETEEEEKVEEETPEED